MCRITVLPQQLNIMAHSGSNLLQVLRLAGLTPDAPCGGQGTCGKCRVTVDGKRVLACRTSVTGDITVVLPEEPQKLLTADTVPEAAAAPAGEGWLLAVDIGTTTLAGYLLDSHGRELACGSIRNPQCAYGADVITRIRHGLKGQMTELTECVQNGIGRMIQTMCDEAGILPGQIRLVSVVGNPAMQQLFLGISPENLARIPFAPVLTQGKTVPAGDYLPLCSGAELLIVPDISGFVGADTVACILASELDTREELTLLVDIGTNGEMVLGNSSRMTACSTAAGPALEGAGILFGMRAQEGAIDHVSLKEGCLCCSVIGGGDAKGICGSGLIDAAAAALEAGWINRRGKILHPSGTIPLASGVYLNQEDIRQLQLVKGAIAAGIALMAEHLQVRTEDIQRVCLAGAFGTYMDPAAACRIGLLPASLLLKIVSLGNAAGSGAKLMARSPEAVLRAQQAAENTEFLELGALPGFRRAFAKHMEF